MLLDKVLRRLQATPYFDHISPHHFHDKDNNTFPSTLTGAMLTDIEIVLGEISDIC
ncbi:MAG: hypothetical protein MAG431_02301 [Chloroflexi bacterium]|nr:hypothetical protein [Chloroflexota bacterium]